MAEKRHHEAGGTVRHTARATNLDFIAFKEWKASMEREAQVEKSFLGFTWQGWERAGDPLRFDAQWQAGNGNLTTFPPTTSSSTGYRSAAHIMFFVGSPPDDEGVSAIESMRMTYVFDGEEHELVVGKNWITYVAAIVVLVIVLLLIIVVAGGAAVPGLALLGIL